MTREVAALLRRMAHERGLRHTGHATYNTIVAAATNRLLVIEDSSVGAVQLRADGDL